MRRDGAGKAGPGPPKNSPMFLANCCFLEPRVGDRPGHPYAAQVKKVKTLRCYRNPLGPGRVPEFLWVSRFLVLFLWFSALFPTLPALF